jgi:hypothetical protein
MHATRRRVPLIRRARTAVYGARVTLRAGTGVATDAVTLLLGGELPKRVVADTLDAELEEYAGDEFWRFGTGRCHRFGRLRVDCEFAAFEWSGRRRCRVVVAARLGSDGIVRARDYRCPRRGQRTHRLQPHYLGRSYVLDISS